MESNSLYEYIIGIVTQIEPTYVVLDVQGIGYLIYMANPYRLTDELNKEVKLYVHHAVREDAHLLYGFRLEEEKKLYLKLIQVSGIGPKSGLAIMANEDHSGFIQAVEEEDTKFLMKFPGVGKKTAAQLVLDLKGKLSSVFSDELGLFSESPDRPHSQAGISKGLHEAKEALAALGYSKRDITRIEPSLESLRDATTDAYLREALTLLMKR